MDMVTHPDIATDDDSFRAQQASYDTFNQKCRQSPRWKRQAPQGAKTHIVHLLTSRHSPFAHSAPYIEEPTSKVSPETHENWAAL